MNRNVTPGFAIELKPDTDLGLAVLMRFDEPVSVVATINEARETASAHRYHGYTLWARGLEGVYTRVPENVWRTK